GQHRQDAAVADLVARAGISGGRHAAVMIAHHMIDIGRDKIGKGCDGARAGEQRHPAAARGDVEVEAKKADCIQGGAPQGRSRRKRCLDHLCCDSVRTKPRAAYFFLPKSTVTTLEPSSPTPSLWGPSFSASSCGSGSSPPLTWNSRLKFTAGSTKKRIAAKGMTRCAGTWLKV